MTAIEFASKVDSVVSSINFPFDELDFELQMYYLKTFLDAYIYDSVDTSELPP